MSGSLLLLGAAVVARLIGASFRRDGRHGLVRAAGWLAVTSAGWMAASAMGAWSPWWPAIVIALVGTLLASRWGGGLLRLLGDVTAAGLIGLLSVPGLSPERIMVAIALATLIGLAADWLVERASIRLPLRHIFIFGSLAIAVLVVTNSSSVIHGWESLSDDVKTINAVGSGLSVFPRSRLVFLGVTPSPNQMGERIELPTGGVAWLDRPPGHETHPGMVFYHGSGPLGSMDPMSIAFRNAAIDAGYVVLSLDHIGIGQSPLPDRDAELSEWDPLPSAAAAVEYLRSLPEVSSVVVAGYSMGAGDVLRVLPISEGIDAAVLLGASAIPPVDYNDFWFASFHSDRRMNTRISGERYDEIIRAYYDVITMATGLPPDHPPLLFINFEHEFDVVLSRQDDLYEAIPGCKSVWQYADTTHYFDLAEVAGLTFGDTRAVKQLSEELRWLRSTLTDPNAAPIC